MPSVTIQLALKLAIYFFCYSANPLGFLYLDSLFRFDLNKPQRLFKTTPVLSNRVRIKLIYTVYVIYINLSMQHLSRDNSRCMFTWVDMLHRRAGVQGETPTEDVIGSYMEADSVISCRPTSSKSLAATLVS